VAKRPETAGIKLSLAIGAGGNTLRSDHMTWFRSADASIAWAIEVARFCLVIFGCAAAGWAVGFGMGYRRGVTDAIAHDISHADHRANSE